MSVEKPVRGVIKHWEFTNHVIYGVVVGYHNKPDDPVGWMSPEHRMRTTRVVRIWTSDGVRYAETLNSLYVLL